MGLVSVTVKQLSKINSVSPVDSPFLNSEGYMTSYRLHQRKSLPELS